MKNYVKSLFMVLCALTVLSIGLSPEKVNAASKGAELFCENRPVDEATGLNSRKARSVSDEPEVFFDNRYINANVGEIVEITGEIYHEYIDERLAVGVLDENGNIICDTILDYYDNNTYVHRFDLTWNTQISQVPAGEYQVVAIPYYYSYGEWWAADSTNADIATIVLEDTNSDSCINGHDLVTVKVRRATYTNAGYTGDIVCRRCKKVIQKGHVIARKKQARPVLKKLKTKTKCVRVYWNKNRTVSGYQIQYSTSRHFTRSKTKTIKVSKNYGYKNIKKLKSKRRYYFRIRSYARGRDCVYYSGWSKVKNIKVK